MSRSVFITGGTGFIGKALVAALRTRGDRAIVVTRDVSRARRTLGEGIELVEGDPSLGRGWQAQVAGVDAIVNLAGAPVAARRWNAQVKQHLRDSRIETTRHLVEAMAALPEAERPSVLVSASGVDYYAPADRFSDDDEVDESAPPGDRFLARLCQRWEEEARAAEDLGVRVALMRTGLVIGPGGPLDKIASPFRKFAGGHLGHGKQWVSWIHIDDAVGAYLHALDDDATSGPINLVAPAPVRAKAFARALGRALGRPSWLPVPGFALEAAVGEFADYLLTGRRAVPTALVASGYRFAYPELDAALASSLAR
ncbi:TIGR01777 family oxidoreductase [Haliangium sp.]|uniref:TIGR01777 family oxidoreductase n=1 Tax=Haliangium sp. TaxID=2663208 RepID=UPI003D1119FB